MIPVEPIVSWFCVGLLAGISNAGLGLILERIFS